LYVPFAVLEDTPVTAVGSATVIEMVLETEGLYVPSPASLALTVQVPTIDEDAVSVVPEIEQDVVPVTTVNVVTPADPPDTAALSVVEPPRIKLLDTALAVTVLLSFPVVNDLMSP
jgi:hypothetical protein